MMDVFGTKMVPFNHTLQWQISYYKILTVDMIDLIELLYRIFTSCHIPSFICVKWTSFCFRYSSRICFVIALRSNEL
jgi:hypothetical protein